MRQAEPHCEACYSEGRADAYLDVVHIASNQMEGARSARERTGKPTYLRVFEAVKYLQEMANESYLIASKRAEITPHTCESSKSPS